MLALRLIYYSSAADVKMEIPFLVRSLKSSFLSSTCFQMGDPLLQSGECCCIFPVLTNQISNSGVILWHILKVWKYTKVKVFHGFSQRWSEMTGITLVNYDLSPMFFFLRTIKVSKGGLVVSLVWSSAFKSAAVSYKFPILLVCSSRMTNF